MKRILCFLIVPMTLAAISSFVSSAQEVDECMLYMGYYQNYYKQGTPTAKMEALNSWRKAYSLCKPGTRQNLYVHGSDLYRMLIAKNAKNAAYRDALIDTLITLHELRAQYYPKYADKAYSNLCMDVNNYLKDKPEKALSILDGIISKQGAKSGPTAFVAQMSAAVELFKDGKLNADRVIDIYENACNCFDEIQKTDDSQMTKDLRSTIENTFINCKVADCDNLIALFTPRFEAAGDDLSTINTIVKIMAKTEGCTDNELFLKAVTKMHQLDPSANSAYFLYKLHSSKDETDKAIQYLSEAAGEDSLEDELQAQYFLELAAYTLKNGLHAKAVSAANKAISYDVSASGKAFMLIGHAWMSVPCNDGNEVEVCAKFWVATDYFNKAKSDPEVAEDAARQIATCAKQYPESSVVFMYDLQNGAPFEISCGGMKATTSVRTK